MALLVPIELKDSGADNLIDTTEETHYTVQANERVIISKAIVKNNDTGLSIPVTIALGAIGDTGTIWAETLTPGEERDISPLLGKSLAGGSLIRKQATTTANKVNIYIDGTRFGA